MGQKVVDDKNNQEEIKQSNKDICLHSSQILDNFGWFQIRSIILLTFPTIGQGIIFIAFVFLNVVPPFQCPQHKQQRNFTNQNVSGILAQDEIDKTFVLDNDHCRRLVNISNTSFESSGNQSIPGFYFEEESCLDSLVFDLSNGNTVVSQKLHNFFENQEVHRYVLSLSFGLVCESAWKRPLTTAAFLLGELFGSAIGGRLADKYGRRLTSILTYLCSTILSLAIAFSYHYWLYVFFCFLNGAMSILTQLTVHTWGIEIAGSPDKRVWASFSFNASFSTGGILSSLIAYLAQDWNWIYIVNTVILSVFLILMWFVPESPSWLLQKQGTEDYTKLLKNIVKTNKINIDFDKNKSELESFKTDNDSTLQEDQSQVKITTKLLWKNKILRRRLVAVCLLWNVVILSYYTVCLNSANLGGNSYLNNVIGNVLDIAAVGATTIALKRQGRKKTLGFGMVALGCFCIASPFATKSNEVAGLCLALIGRFFAMAVVMITVLFSGELFPTMLRNTSICIASAMSRSAAIATPFLVFVGEEVDLSIPFYVMGGVGFASIILISLLPETSQVPLLNTLDDALALKNPRFYSKKKRKSHQKKKQSSNVESNEKNL